MEPFIKDFKKIEPIHTNQDETLSVEGNNQTPMILENNLKAAIIYDQTTEYSQQDDAKYITKRWPQF